MDSKGRYYTEETLRSEVIEPEITRENRAERRKRAAEQRRAQTAPPQLPTATILTAHQGGQKDG